MTCAISQRGTDCPSVRQEINALSVRRHATGRCPLLSQTLGNRIPTRNVATTERRDIPETDHALSGSAPSRGGTHSDLVSREVLALDKSLFFVPDASALVSLPPPQTPAATPRALRTWTDSTGRFKVQARFVRIDGDTVVVEDEQGQQRGVPLSRLSRLTSSTSANRP